MKNSGLVPDTGGASLPYCPAPPPYYALIMNYRRPSTCFLLNQSTTNAMHIPVACFSVQVYSVPYTFLACPRKEYSMGIRQGPKLFSCGLIGLTLPPPLGYHSNPYLSRCHYSFCVLINEPAKLNRICKHLRSLCSLAESIPGLLKRLRIWAYIIFPQCLSLYYWGYMTGLDNS
jgi:hypothetical protein